MELTHLKAFVAVADCLSFTRAALQLNMSQPAVSLKVKALERDLGVSLFRRLHHRIELTDGGVHTLEAGRRILNEVEALSLHFRKEHDHSGGRVTVCIPAAIGLSTVAPLLNRLDGIKSHDIIVDLKSCGSDRDVMEHVAQSQAAIGIARFASEHPELLSVPWCTHQLSLLVHPNHWGVAAGALSIEEIRRERILFPELNSGDDALLRHRLLTLGLDASDFPERRHVPVDLMPSLVASGQWVAFNFSLPWLDASGDGLRNLRLHEFPLPYALHLLSRQVRPAERPRHTAHATPAEEVHAALVSLGASLEAHRHAQLIESLSRAQGKTPREVLHRNFRAPCLRRSPLQDPPASGMSRREPEATPFRIGVQHRTIQTVLAGRAVQQLGLLETFLEEECFTGGAMIRPQWIDHVSAAPMTSALLKGDLDLAIIGDYAITHLANTCPEASKDSLKLVSFVSVNPHGSGASLILPRNSTLKDLQSLASHSIAVPSLSTAYGSLLYNLSAQELTEKVDVRCIDLDSGSDQRLDRVEADGYAFFTPLDHCLESGLRYRRIDDQISVPMAFYGVMVRDAFARSHPGAVKAFLKAMACSRYWFYTTPSSIQRLSLWTGIEERIVHSVLGIREGREARDCHYQPDLCIRQDWLEEYALKIYSRCCAEGDTAVVLPEVEEEFLETALQDLDPFCKVQTTTSPKLITTSSSAVSTANARIG